MTVLTEAGCTTQIKGTLCAVTDDCVVLRLDDNGFGSLSPKLGSLTEAE
jgi:hypothetical protein